MSIQTPTELSYYYECSYGKFRLVYHIPINILSELVEQQEISFEVLDDYPDGIDLDCSPSDYKQFKKIYNYTPLFNPEDVRRAFFMLFSSKYIWKDYRGSGFLSANYLESLIKPVNSTLKAQGIDLSKSRRKFKSLSNKKRRQARINRSKMQIRINNILEETPITELAFNKPLTTQSFSPEMNKGEKPESVFSKAHQGRRRKK